MWLDSIVVAMDHQDRAADFAIHGLARIKGRRYRPRVHRPGEDGSRSLAGPANGILDLLSRMWLGEDGADEVSREILIVREPVGVVVFVPVLELCAPGLKVVRRHVRMGGPYAGRCTDQD